MAKKEAPHINDLPGPAAIKRSVANADDPNYVELVLQDHPHRRFVNISVTREDKEATDSIQGWYSFRQGDRVPLWRIYNLLLADALGNPEGRFYRMTERTWV